MRRQPRSWQLFKSQLNLAQPLEIGRDEGPRLRRLFNWPGVDVIDGHTNKVIARIPVSPEGIASIRLLAIIYVTSEGNETTFNDEAPVQPSRL